MTHKFHPSIIRAYDIRGIYGQTLHDKDAFYVAKSFASFLKKSGKKKISVACDGRLSSPSLKAELIKGLVESGLEVIDVGMGPTPMLYFSVYHLNQDAGIMITGSHNAKEYNGFKMMLKDRPFFGDDIKNLAIIAEEADFVNEEGEVDAFAPKRKLKIAWDAGNGSAGEIMKRLTNKIAADHILLFEEVDGNFPNHHPDPTVPKNLEDLRAVVLKESCDIGIAFDGDGDRIGVVDNEGEIIWGDQLMVFYARDILQDRPHSTIIADVKASNILFDEIRKAGGNAVMWKTGHSFIKAKMKETKAVLAGEMSGHIFFADKYYGYDDALYAAIRIIDIIIKSFDSLATLRKSLPQAFATPEIRIDCIEERKFSIIDDLKVNLKESGLQFDDIDGIRVTDGNGWWLMRASNTQAALVARCEANSNENLEKLKANLRNNLEFCQVEIPQELL